MKHKLTFAAIFVTLVIVPTLASAAVPGVIPIQGILTDAEGAPIENNVAVTFTLYDATDDSELFTETLSVTPESGFFSVELGAGAVALDLTLFRDNPEVELGIQVGADDEMTPRLHFGSVPYAVASEYAAEAATLEGSTAADLDTRYVEAGETDSVTSDMISDGTVTPDDLQSAIALYEVTNIHCENPPGTITTTDECYANQKFASGCPDCTDITAPRKFKRCDGTCSCGPLLACLNPPCSPRLGVPKCPNQPLVAYGVSP